MTLESINSWNATSYIRDGSYVSELATIIFTWLNPKSGEDILDIGCGEGALTKKITDIGANVIGIDLNEDMLKSAKSHGLNVYRYNAENFEFDKKFDAIFSNAAFHWFQNPQKVLNQIAKHLKQNGRLVCEFGGHTNIAAIMVAIRAIANKYDIDHNVANPFFNPTCDEFCEMLNKAGLQPVRIELSPRPTPLPAGMVGWLNLFRNNFFNQFDAPQRADVINETIELLKPSLCDNSGNWTADYVRIRAEAILG